MISTLRKRHQTIVSNKKRRFADEKKTDVEERALRTDYQCRSVFHPFMLCDCFLYSEK